MRWGCCYTHRSKWTSEIKKKHGQQQFDAIILHEHTSYQKKTDDSRMNHILSISFVCTKHQCGCYVQIQMIFVSLLLLELGPLFYIMLLNCS